jgi:hypothetical protein
VQPLELPGAERAALDRRVRATDRLTQAGAEHKRRIKDLVRQLLPTSPLVGELGMADLVLPASRREHVDVVAGEHVGNVRSPAGWCWAGLDGRVVGVMLTRSRFR